jgi:prefoldin subunit 5
MVPKDSKEAEALEAEAKEYESQAKQLERKLSSIASPKRRSECKEQVRNLRTQAKLRRNLVRAKAKSPRG